MGLPPRSTPRGKTVLIVGAGVGGLMAALECWRHGFDVRILERTKTNSLAGDSFNIGVTAINAFRNWPDMRARSDQVAYKASVAYHKQTGERLFGPADFTSMLPQHVVKEEGIDYKRMPRHSRPKFHLILLEQLQKIGVDIEYDHAVVEYFENEGSKRGGVVLESGERLEADLVVAADGVRGQSWRIVGSGSPVPARSSGDAVFRVAFDRKLIEDDKEIVERFGQTDNGHTIAEVWSGPNMFAGFWLNEDQMTWVISHPDNGSAEESWGHRALPAEALAFTKGVPGWPAYADRVIAATPTDALVDWKLIERDPQPKWYSPGGHVVQLGDAAHTFLPSSGNGATQALEDAVSLAACLGYAEDHSTASIADAVKVHNLLRFQRVSFLQAMGIRNRDARDTTKNKDEKKMVATFGAWIVKHDAEDYARENFDEALRHVRNATQAEFKHKGGVPKRPYVPWTVDGLMEGLRNGEETILDGDWS